jgi:hypothetical protein
MPLDLQNPLASGGMAVAAAVYVGASLYVTGPLVAERTIERSGWQRTCQAHLSAAVTKDEPLPAFVPKLDCQAFLGWFGADGRAVCDAHGNPSFALPGFDQLEAQRRRLDQLRHEQLAARVAQSPSRCACAVTVTLERHRTDFALYAGSARLITPSAVRNLSSELQTSLRTPICAGHPEDAP